MKSKLRIVMVVMVVMVVVVLMACAVSPIAGVAPGPKSSVIRVPSVSSTPASVGLNQETIIKQVLINSQNAWNEKDTERYLSLFTEDAEIMVGREQKIVSKKDYIKMFPTAFDRVGTVRYKSVSVRVLDAKKAEAEGVAFILTSQGILRITKRIHLINQNDKWLINKSMFQIHSRGEELSES